MKVEAFIIAFNEAETIHLTIKHYQQFCQRITIFDNHSTDNTRDIALSMGCDVRIFGIKGVLSDQEYLNVKNHCWKKSECDWVIVCDADEILYHPDIASVLSENCTVFKTYGWNVFSNDIPRETWTEITTGVHDQNYSKSIIFSPSIQEIGYIYGCHDKRPKGDIRLSKSTLALLHYKHVGGADRIVKRHALYNNRLSDHNKRWKLGFQYSESEAKTREYFDQMLAKSCEFSESLLLGT